MDKSVTELPTEKLTDITKHTIAPKCTSMVGLNIWHQVKIQSRYCFLCVQFIASEILEHKDKKLRSKMWFENHWPNSASRYFMLGLNTRPERDLTLFAYVSLVWLTLHRPGVFSMLFGISGNVTFTAFTFLGDISFMSGFLANVTFRPLLVDRRWYLSLLIGSKTVKRWSHSIHCYDIP